MIKAYRYRRSVLRDIFNIMTSKRDVIYNEIIEIYIPSEKITFNSDADISNETIYSFHKIKLIYSSSYHSIW